MVYSKQSASVEHQLIKLFATVHVTQPKPEKSMCKMLNNILNIQNCCALFLPQCKIYNLKDSLLNFRIYNFEICIQFTPDSKILLKFSL